MGLQGIIIMEINHMQTLCGGGPVGFEPVREAWVVGGNPAWRAWAGKLLESRGLTWTALSWQAWDARCGQGGLPELVLTDGRRGCGIAMASGVRVVEAGERLPGPWDAGALADALDAAGVSAAVAGNGLWPSPRVAPAGIGNLVRRYAVAGRRAVDGLNRSLDAFRRCQPGPLAGGDFLAEANEKSRELEGLVDALDRTLNPARVTRGECPVWPVVEDAFDLGCFESGWTWQDGLPDALPDIAAGRCQVERVMESVVAAIGCLRSGSGAAVHVGARMTESAPCRELVVECRGLPAGLGAANPELAMQLVVLASRLADAGGRLEEDAAGIWRCFLPVRPQAAWRLRAEVPAWPRVLVVASDSRQSSLYSRLLWRRGCVPVEVRTCARAVAVEAGTGGRRKYAAAVVAEGPGAMPDADAVRLGRLVPVLVIRRSGDRLHRWQAVPGVTHVLPGSVDPNVACRVLETVLDGQPPVVSGDAGPGS